MVSEKETQSERATFGREVKELLCVPQGNIDRLRHQIKKIINLNLRTHCNMVIPYTWQDVVQQTLEIYTR